MNFNSLATLISVLNTNKPANIETLVASGAPEIRENFVLLYESKSLQPASQDRPRVILHNSDASFLMAYSGFSFLEKADQSSNNVEIISFNSKTSQFEFAEIRFPEGRIELNPSKCSTCHTPSLRPNWDPYPNWPGVYGSAINSLNTSAGIAAKTVEGHMWKEFLTRGPQLSRYKSLDFSKDSAALSRPDSEAINLRASHNTAFTINLATNNFKRIAANVRNLNKPKAIEWLKTSITDPEVILSASPVLNGAEPAFLTFLANTSPQILEKIKTEQNSGISTLISRYNATVAHSNPLSGLQDLLKTGGEQWPDDRDRLPITAFVSLGNALGLRTEDWSMNFRGGWFFSSGSSGIRDFLKTP